MSSSDKLDLVLFGATGYTGKFCVEHLLENYCSDEKTNYKFGLAARNMDKLKVIVNSFIHENKNAEKFELIECDILDSKQVTSVIQRTNVCITTVGPYNVYGENLITICAQNGVDYVDLTGESHWVANMIQKCDKDAIKSKARIVNTAGAMCSIMDCALYSCIKQLKDDEKKSDTNYSVRTMQQAPKSAGLGGGSCQTIINIYKQGGMGNYFDQKVSYSLCPDNNKYSNIQKRKGFYLPIWNTELQRYEAPAGMFGSVEKMVFCRSNHLLEYFYGKAPVFNDSVMLFKSRHYIIALLVCIFSFIVPYVLVNLSFLKRVLVKLMEWILPESGIGPYTCINGLDREKMESAIWKQYAFVEDKSSEKGVKVEAVIYGDYGYYNTGKLLVEEGMIFVEQRKKGIDTTGGFVTPAVAFGKNDQLIQRLNDLKQFDIKFTNIKY
eukprot:44967_1